MFYIWDSGCPDDIFSYPSISTFLWVSQRRREREGGGWRGWSTYLAIQSLGSAPATLHMSIFGETFAIGNNVIICTFIKSLLLDWSLPCLPFVWTARLDRSVHKWNSSILPNWESCLWVNWTSFKNRVSLARNSSHLYIITFADWSIKQASSEKCQLGPLS